MATNLTETNLSCQGKDNLDSKCCNRYDYERKS